MTGLGRIHLSSQIGDFFMLRFRRYWPQGVEPNIQPVRAVWPAKANSGDVTIRRHVATGSEDAAMWGRCRHSVQATVDREWDGRHPKDRR
jgi:hypothetical protein